MKNAWIVFVESNTSGTGCLFAGKAADNGYRPIFLVARPERYSFLERGLFPFLQCHTGSLPSLQETLERLSREAPVAGIFSSSDYFLETAAILAGRYGLGGANPAALQKGRNKWIQRQSLKEAGLNTPEFGRADAGDVAVAVACRIGLPVIVKPTLESGSFGVRLCQTFEEVAGHAGLLLKRTVNARGIPIPQEVLIEEYLVGPEYSAEAFGGRVLGITRKHLSQEPFFVELGHDFPATLPGELFRQIAGVVEHALEALDLTWGPAHVELRLHEKGPTIIEVNPRLAGGFIPEIVKLASGIDMIGGTIRLLVGEQPNLQPQKSSHASIRFLTSPQNGTITKITGVDEALKIEGIADIQTYRRAGERLQIENDFRDRIGHIISCADSAETAARCAELARDKIEIEVES